MSEASQFFSSLRSLHIFVVNVRALSALFLPWHRIHGVLIFSMDLSSSNLMRRDAIDFPR